MRTAIALALVAFASPAYGNNWYQIDSGHNQCVNVTEEQTSAGNPQLGTPTGIEALYQSLGENVTLHQVEDVSGAAIIVLRVTGDSGDLILNTTYFPSLSDCQFVLSYDQSHNAN